MSKPFLIRNAAGVEYELRDRAFFRQEYQPQGFWIVGEEPKAPASEPEPGIGAAPAEPAPEKPVLSKAEGPKRKRGDEDGG